MATRSRPPRSAPAVEEILRIEPLVKGPDNREAPPQPTIERVQVPQALPLVVGASALIAVVLLYLTRHFDFFSDEWTFVLGAPGWGLKSLFVPHNEHWSTLLIAWYKLAFSLFGARNYHVFMAGVLFADAAVACLLFILIRRRSGPVLALAAAAIMLVLGNGWEDILWAFQVAWVGATAFGLLAVLLLQGEKVPSWRLALSSAALLCALMCGGPGLFWLVLVTVDLFFSPLRRRYLGVIVVPLVAYLAWFVAIGHSNLATQRSPFSKDALIELPTFVPAGIGAAFSGVFGPSSRGRDIALVVVAVAVGIRWYQRGRKIDTLALGAAAALVCEFVLTGLVRGQYGDLAATTSRYVWVAAVFALIILTDAARGLPWNRPTQAALILILVISMGLNGLHLRQQIQSQNAFFASQDAELQVTWMVRQAPSINRQGSIPIRLAGPGTPPVTVGGYIDSRKIMGSQLGWIQPSDLGYLDPAAVNVAFANALVVEKNLVATPSQAGSGACTASDPSGSALVQAADRSVWLLTPSSPGPVTITVWYEGPASSAPSTTMVVGAGQSLELVLPDSGLGLTWHLQAAVPAYLSLGVCPTAR